MKKIFLLLLLSFPVACSGQTGLAAVMVNSNGVIQRPTNFWDANQIGQVEYKYQTIFDNSDNYSTNGASVFIANSYAQMSLGTNANSKASMRLISKVNTRSGGGLGPNFANDTHAIAANIECDTSDNGITRFVLGNNQNDSSPGNYPTTRAFGFEMRTVGSATNQIRLIAHNGTNSTNGQWVNVGLTTDRFLVMVEKKKAQSAVELSVGLNNANPTLNASATISGGPTTAGSAADGAYEVAIESTTANPSTASVNMFAAWVEVMD